jgi:hypothetical protein
MIRGLRERRRIRNLFAPREFRSILLVDTAENENNQNMIGPTCHLGYNHIEYNGNDI